jgi:hypothetical protein
VMVLKLCFGLMLGSYMECDWSKKVWFTSPLSINFSNMYLTLIDWLQYILREALSDNMEIIVTTIYLIWNVRNNFIFQKKDIHVLELVRCNQIDLSKSATALAGRNKNLRFNVDAHSLGDSHWGISLRGMEVALELRLG